MDVHNDYAIRSLRPTTVALYRHSQPPLRWGKLLVKIMAQSVPEFYTFCLRIESIVTGLLAHVNRLMGVVHTTCRTTMLIAMYFGEYPIYLSFSSPFDMCSVYIQTRLSELLYFYAILLYLAYGFTFWCSICSSRCVLKIYLSYLSIYCKCL